MRRGNTAGKLVIKSSPPIPPLQATTIVRGKRQDNTTRVLYRPLGPWLMSAVASSVRHQKHDRPAACSDAPTPVRR
jgi:hypothetical protein